MSSLPRRIAAGSSLLTFALFVAACVVPAVEARKGQPVGSFVEFSDRNDRVAHRGWLTLAVGWMAVIAELLDFNGPLHPFNVAGLAWLANPMALAGAALLRVRRSAAAATCGWIGVGLGVAFLVSPLDYERAPVVPRIGAYLWVGSLVVFATGASAAGILGWVRVPVVTTPQNPDRTQGS